MEKDLDGEQIVECCKMRERLYAPLGCHTTARVMAKGASMHGKFFKCHDLMLAMRRSSHKVTQRTVQTRKWTHVRYEVPEVGHLELLLKMLWHGKAKVSQERMHTILVHFPLLQYKQSAEFAWLLNHV